MATTTMEEVLCYSPIIHPSEPDTPAPNAHPPIPLIKAPPSPTSSSFPSLRGIGSSSNTSSKATRRILSSPAGSTSERSGGAPLSLPSSPFGLGGTGLGMPKMAADYSGGYISGGAEAECFFGAWVGCDDSCKKEMEWVLAGRWRHGLEDMDT
jgi:hypothetical protein